MCPITRSVSDFPLEVPVISDCGISGVVMSDQVKSTDWRARYAKYAGKVDPIVVDQVVENINALLGV